VAKQDTEKESWDERPSAFLTPKH